MTISSVGSFVTGTNSSSVTSFNVTTSLGLAVGDVVLIQVTADNVGTTSVTNPTSGTSNEITGMSLPNNGSLTKVGEVRNSPTGTGNDGCTVALFYCKATAIEASGANLTISMASTSAKAKAIAGWKFGATQVSFAIASGVTPVGTTSVTAAQGSLSVTPSTSKEYLWFRASGCETGTRTTTVTTNFTAVTTASNGSTSATGLTAGGEFRIFTGTSNASAPSWSAACDNASIYVAFEESNTTIGSGAGSSTSTSSAAAIPGGLNYLTTYGQNGTGVTSSTVTITGPGSTPSSTLDFSTYLFVTVNGWSTIVSAGNTNYISASDSNGTLQKIVEYSTTSGGGVALEAIFRRHHLANEVPSNITLTFGDANSRDYEARTHCFSVTNGNLALHSDLDLSTISTGSTSITRTKGTYSDSVLNRWFVLNAVASAFSTFTSGAKALYNSGKTGMFAQAGGGTSSLSIALSGMTTDTKVISNFTIEEATAIQTTAGTSAGTTGGTVVLQDATPPPTASASVTTTVTGRPGNNQLSNQLVYSTSSTSTSTGSTISKQGTIESTALGVPSVYYAFVAKRNVGTTTGPSNEVVSITPNGQTAAQKLYEYTYSQGGVAGDGLVVAVFRFRVASNAIVPSNIALSMPGNTQAGHLVRVFRFINSETRTSLSLGDFQVYGGEASTGITHSFTYGSASEKTIFSWAVSELTSPSVTSDGVTLSTGTSAFANALSYRATQGTSASVTNTTNATGANDSKLYLSFTVEDIDAIQSRDVSTTVSSTASGSLDQVGSIGSSTGTSTVLGYDVGGGAPLSGDGTSTGTSTVSGDGIPIYETVGSSSATSTAVAASSGSSSGDGSATGNSTVSGVGASTWVTTGSATTTSDSTAVGQSTRAGDGSSAGTSTTSGTAVAIFTATASASTASSSSSIPYGFQYLGTTLVGTGGNTASINITADTVYQSARNVPYYVYFFASVTSNPSAVAGNSNSVTSLVDSNSTAWQKVYEYTAGNGSTACATAIFRKLLSTSETFTSLTINIAPAAYGLSARAVNFMASTGNIINHPYSDFVTYEGTSTAGQTLSESYGSSADHLLLVRGVTNAGSTWSTNGFNVSGLNSVSTYTGFTRSTGTTSSMTVSNTNADQKLYVGFTLQDVSGIASGAGSSTITASVAAVGASFFAGQGSITATSSASGALTQVGSVASATGTSTVTGRALTTGSISGTSTATATGILIAGTVASTTITSTASAVGTQVGSIASATATASSTATGSQVGSVASATGTSTVTGRSLGTGTIVVATTVSGVGKSTWTATGSIIGTSTVSATSGYTIAIVGTSTGTSTASGVGDGARLGVITATATASGVGASTWTATSSATGTSTVTGFALETGVASAAATVNGVGKSTWTATASTSGTSSVTAVSGYTQAVVGTATGTSIASGIGDAARTGVITGTSTANGVGASTWTATGTITVVSQAQSGGMSQGSISATASASGVLLATIAGQGASSTTSSATATGAVVLAAAGNSSGTANSSAVGQYTREITGTMSATASAAATGAATFTATATSIGTSAVSAFTQGVTPTTGSSSGAGVVNGQALATGSAAATSSSSGAFTVVGSLTASTTASSTVTGIPTGLQNLGSFASNFVNGSSHSSITLTTTKVAAPGTTLFASLTKDNSNISSFEFGTDFTDSLGNSWVLDSFYVHSPGNAAADGVAVGVFQCYVTNNIPSGTSITFNYDGAVSASAASMFGFLTTPSYKLKATGAFNVITGTASNNYQTFSMGKEGGYTGDWLYIRFSGVERGSQSVTYSAPFGGSLITPYTVSTSSGSTVTTSVTNHNAYIILPNTTTSYDVGGTWTNSSDFAELVTEFTLFTLVPTGAGTVTATSSVNGVMQWTDSKAGVVTGTSSASASITAITATVASTSVTNDVSAQGSSTWTAAGSSSGTALMVGLTGSIAVSVADSTADGAGAPIFTGDATTSSTSSAPGIGNPLGVGVSAITTTSSASGVLRATSVGTGTSTGTSSVSALGTPKNTGHGSIIASSTATSVMTATAVFEGNVLIVSTDAQGILSSITPAVASASVVTDVSAAGQGLPTRTVTSTGTTIVAGVGRSTYAGAASTTTTSGVTGVGKYILGTTASTTVVNTASANGTEVQSRFVGANFTVLVVGRGQKILTGAGSSSVTSFADGRGIQTAKGTAVSTDVALDIGYATAITPTTATTGGSGVTVGIGSIIKTGAGNITASSSANGVAAPKLIATGSSSVSSSSSGVFTAIHTRDAKTSTASSGSAVGRSTVAATGSASVTSTVQAPGSIRRSGAGSSTGTSSSSAVTAYAWITTGTSNGTSSMSSVGSNVKTSSASASGTSTAAASGVKINGGSGVIIIMVILDGRLAATSQTAGQSANQAQVLAKTGSIRAASGSSSQTTIAAALGKSTNSTSASASTVATAVSGGVILPYMINTMTAASSSSSVAFADGGGFYDAAIDNMDNGPQIRTKTDATDLRRDIYSGDGVFKKKIFSSNAKKPRRDLK